MSTLVSLNEAATFLGVSKGTLRNWDNEGKLVAIRNPLNGYRQYDLESLVVLKNTLQGTKIGESTESDTSESDSVSDKTGSKAVKAAVSKLHSIIRDYDANSNIVTRFDEISKLLFVRLMLGRSAFESEASDQPGDYLDRVQSKYNELLRLSGKTVPEKFSRILLSEKALRACADVLDGIVLDDSQVDVKGLAYEDTIRGTFDKSDNQQYFTPYQVVDFMVGAVSSFLSGTVCDPACGTAGFLTKAVAGSDAKALGLEVDERLAWVSTLNLLLHGRRDFDVECLDEGGSLGRNAQRYFGTVDVILTNPPFGSDYTDRTILDGFELGRGKTSRRRGILFIEQAWNLLRDGGVVAIVIDQSVLNAGTNVDVRRFILSHYSVLGVVDLPDTAFMPYASVSTSILLLQKHAGMVAQERTFFAKSERIGRKSNGDDDMAYSSSGKPSLNSDLPGILEDWRLFLNGADAFTSPGCFVADITEYKDEDRTLRMDYAFHHPMRNESRRLLDKATTRLLPLAEVCSERNQSYVPAADPNAVSIPFTGLANIESYTGIAVQEMTPATSIKSSVKRYEPRDIVFSKMRPALRKVAVMNTEEGGYVSSECAVFTVRQDANGRPLMNPDVLSTILRSDFVFGQIMPYVTGIGRPRISGKNLRNVLVPVPPASLQEKTLENLRAQQNAVAQLRVRSKALEDEARTLEGQMINNVALMMAGE